MREEVEKFRPAVHEELESAEEVLAERAALLDALQGHRRQTSRDARRSIYFHQRRAAAHRVVGPYKPPPPDDRMCDGGWNVKEAQPGDAANRQQPAIHVDNALG